MHSLVELLGKQGIQNLVNDFRSDGGNTDMENVRPISIALSFEEEKKNREKNPRETGNVFRPDRGDPSHGVGRVRSSYLAEYGSTW